MLQLNKLCVKYGVGTQNLKNHYLWLFNDGWLSGFIDSDGSIYFNENSGQVFISCRAAPQKK